MSNAIQTALAGQLPDLRRKYGVRALALFGSQARGDARPDSDVDLLVEFENPTFDNFMNLKFDLEQRLRRPVDLVTRAALRPRLRPYIEAEAIALT